jgi:AcrR family transcriptional regulator
VHTSHRTYNKLSKRAEIVSAARNVFIKKGFGAATLDEIAQAADVAKGTLYGYFQNKEDLFVSLVEDELDKIRVLVLETLGTEPKVIRGIQRFIHESIGQSDQHWAILRIFTPEGIRVVAQRHPEVRDRILPRFREIARLTASHLSRGIENGELKPINPDVMAMNLLWLLRSVSIDWRLLRDEEVPKDVVSSITTLFLKGAQEEEA